MKLLAILSTFAALAVPAAGAGAGETPLDGYRGTSRVLVIAAPEAGDARVAAQRQAIAAARTQASERELVTVEALGGGPEAEAIRRKLDIPADAFRAVLIGKDGGAKLISEAPIPVETLFATIDAMPMRRREMQR